MQQLPPTHQAPSQSLVYTTPRRTSRHQHSRLPARRDAHPALKARPNRKHCTLRPTLSAHSVPWRLEPSCAAPAQGGNTAPNTRRGTQDAARGATQGSHPPASQPPQPAPRAHHHRASRHHRAPGQRSSYTRADLILTNSPRPLIRDPWSAALPATIASPSYTRATGWAAHLLARQPSYTLTPNSPLNGPQCTSRRHQQPPTASCLLAAAMAPYPLR